MLCKCSARSRSLALVLSCSRSRTLCTPLSPAPPFCPSRFAFYALQALPPTDAAIADAAVRVVPLSVVVPSGVSAGDSFAVTSPHGGAPLTLIADGDAGSMMTVQVSAPDIAQSTRTALVFCSAIDLGGYVPGWAVRQQATARALTVSRLREMVLKHPPPGGWTAPVPKGPLSEQLPGGGPYY